MPQLNNDPILNELQAMKQRMDAIYSQSVCSEPVDPPEKITRETAWEPVVDIWEAENEWLLVVDLPGVHEADLQVELADDHLIIAGEREVVPPGKGYEISQAERPRGRFSRMFVLPDEVRKDGIEAELKHGVLTVRIPRTGAARTGPLRVAVHAG